MINDFLNAKGMQPIIDSHGVESVKEQFYLMQLFEKQYNPDIHGDFKSYLLGRLKSYHELD